MSYNFSKFFEDYNSIIDKQNVLIDNILKVHGQLSINDQTDLKTQLKNAKKKSKHKILTEYFFKNGRSTINKEGEKYLNELMILYSTLVKFKNKNR